MYSGYAWLTNQVPPSTTGRRLLLVAGMAAFFVCALAIPRAFDGTGLVFGLGYLCVASHLTAQVDERDRAGFDVRPSHFVERHGGLLIVALGESVVAVGIG